MRYLQLSVHGDTFVGLLGFATDRYAVLSDNFPKNDVFQVPSLCTKVYGTNLVGLLCQGNSNGILLPYFVSEDDILKVKKFAEGLGVNVGKVHDRHTALGNMLACNDHGAIASPLLEDVKVIRDVLDVEVAQMKVASSTESGACLLATNKGFIAHHDAEGQLQEIENVLKVKGMCGTVNYGVPYVKSGVIANSNGYIAGTTSSGIELGRIEDALGFM
ncbi:MAG: translation initiation factor IF-6 [Candidatus Altiarchaeota archaeon]|nr:translation initiation factor IF-6 [Candidatus Altiarchaeota archaeon]